VISAYLRAYTYTGQHNTENLGHVSVLRPGFEPAIPPLTWSKSVIPQASLSLYRIYLCSLFIHIFIGSVFMKYETDRTGENVVLDHFKTISSTSGPRLVGMERIWGVPRRS
jgi:hypothetical protein